MPLRQKGKFCLVFLFDLLDSIYLVIYSVQYYYCQISKFFAKITKITKSPILVQFVKLPHFLKFFCTILLLNRYFFCNFNVFRLLFLLPNHEIFCNFFDPILQISQFLATLLRKLPNCQ